MSLSLSFSELLSPSPTVADGGTEKALGGRPPALTQLVPSPSPSPGSEPVALGYLMDAKMSTIITYSDQVEIDKSSLKGARVNLQGFVRFVGKVKGRETVLYGIELKKRIAIGDGSQRGVRYFQCARGKALFVKRAKIVKHCIMDDKMQRVSYGDYVKVFLATRYEVAVIRYVGCPSDTRSKTCYFGLELLECSKGDCDGSYNGNRLFKCPMRRGLFVKASRSMQKCCKPAPIKLPSAGGRRSKRGRRPLSDDRSDTDKSHIYGSAKDKVEFKRRHRKRARTPPVGSVKAPQLPSLERSRHSWTASSPDIAEIKSLLPQDVVVEELMSPAVDDSPKTAYLKSQGISFVGYMLPPLIEPHKGGHRMERRHGVSSPIPAKKRQEYSPTMSSSAAEHSGDGSPMLHSLSMTLPRLSVPQHAVRMGTPTPDLLSPVSLPPACPLTQAPSVPMAPPRHVRPKLRRKKSPALISPKSSTSAIVFDAADAGEEPATVKKTTFVSSSIERSVTKLSTATGSSMLKATGMSSSLWMGRIPVHLSDACCLMVEVSRVAFSLGELRLGIQRALNKVNGWTSPMWWTLHYTDNAEDILKKKRKKKKKKKRKGSITSATRIKLDTETALLKLRKRDAMFYNNGYIFIEELPLAEQLTPQGSAIPALRRVVKAMRSSKLAKALTHLDDCCTKQLDLDGGLGAVGEGSIGGEAPISIADADFFKAFCYSLMTDSSSVTGFSSVTFSGGSELLLESERCTSMSPPLAMALTTKMSSSDTALCSDSDESSFVEEPIPAEDTTAKSAFTLTLMTADSSEMKKKKIVSLTESISMWHSAVKSDAQNVEAWLNLGQSLECDKKFAQALKYYGIADTVLESILNASAASVTPTGKLVKKSRKSKSMSAFEDLESEITSALELETGRKRKLTAEDLVKIERTKSVIRLRINYCKILQAQEEARQSTISSLREQLEANKAEFDVLMSQMREMEESYRRQQLAAALAPSSASPTPIANYTDDDTKVVSAPDALSHVMEDCSSMASSSVAPEADTDTYDDDDEEEDDDLIMGDLDSEEEVEGFGERDAAAADEEENEEVPGEELDADTSPDAESSPPMEVPQLYVPKMFWDECTTRSERLVCAREMPRLCEEPIGSEARFRLMSDKLDICCERVSFTGSEVAGSVCELVRLNKQELLEECVEEWSSVAPKTVPEYVVADCFSCIEANLFRTLPEDPFPTATEEEDDELYEDPTWDHLHAAYDLTLRMLSTARKKHLSPRLDSVFLQKIMSRFDSADRREHLCVQIVLRSVYKRFTSKRGTLIGLMTRFCLHFIETERIDRKYSGAIAEILQIVTKIFDGMKVDPIKDALRVLWAKVVLPLHKCHHYGCYQNTLQETVVAFLNRAPLEVRALDHYFGTLLRFWPKCSHKKTLLYIGSVLTTLQNEDVYAKYMDVMDSSDIVLTCVKKVIGCVSDLNIQVSHAALSFLVEEAVIDVIDARKEDYWPEVIKHLTATDEGDGDEEEEIETEEVEDGCDEKDESEDCSTSLEESSSGSAMFGGATEMWAKKSSGTKAKPKKDKNAWKSHICESKQNLLTCFRYRDTEFFNEVYGENFGQPIFSSKRTDHKRIRSWSIVTDMAETMASGLILVGSPTADGR